MSSAQNGWLSVTIIVRDDQSGGIVGHSNKALFILTFPIFIRVKIYCKVKGSTFLGLQRQDLDEGDLLMNE